MEVISSPVGAIEPCVDNLSLNIQYVYTAGIKTPFFVIISAILDPF